MEKKPLKGEDLKERLKAAARDRLHRFLLSDGEVRGALVNGRAWFEKCGPIMIWVSWRP